MADWACAKCGGDGPRLAAPPMAGSWGERISAATCATCWQAWQATQIQVINHYGLKPHLASDRAKIYEHMASFLGLA